MCSVVGYIGDLPAYSLIGEGLRRLEYRGYDSAGMAWINAKTYELEWRKAAGAVNNLLERLPRSHLNTFLGIGHTRWATHGIANDQNAHPHLDCAHTVAVVHNGIIENYRLLRAELHAQNHTFLTETDTEIIVHLLEEELRHNQSVVAAMARIMQRLQGAYAFLAIRAQQPDLLIAARYRAPLYIGKGNHGIYVASDPIAFAGAVEHIWYVPDGTYVLLSRTAINAYTHGTPVTITWEPYAQGWDDVSKKQYQHYMLKEIYEQKQVISTALHAYSTHENEYLTQLGETFDNLGLYRQVHLVGAGTSWHAALMGKFFFESVAKIPVQVSLASEFRYMPFFPSDHTLYMGITRSGETADTIEALRLIRQQGKRATVMTDMPLSSAVRETDGFFLTHAGVEIAVASTKAFTAQVVALYWLAASMAVSKGYWSATQRTQALEELYVAAGVLDDMLEYYKKSIEQMASYYAHYNRFIFLGRHLSYAFALEAALKLKEIAYVFVQCYPAGELKHGHIALIDEQTPVCIFSHADALIYQKLLSNAQEVKARAGRLIVFCFEGQDELKALADHVFVFPRVSPLLGPVVMTGVMQFFAYAIAHALKRPIDRPRNLAKAVTVE